MASLEDNLTASQPALQSASINIEELQALLSSSSIISQSFLRLAFTVLDHYVVAQLIIVIPSYCAIFRLGLALWDS